MAAARKVAVVALFFPCCCLCFHCLCSSAFSLSLLHSFPVLVGVLPDDSDVAVVVVAPNDCCGGDEEGSGGGPIFPRCCL